MTELNREYATALYAIAAENGAQDAYEAGLDIVLAAFEQNPEYKALLSAPAIPISERLAALEEAFLNAVPEEVLSFVQLLCEHGRVAELAACVQEYKLLMNEYHRRILATVRSGVPLTTEEMARPTKKLEKISGHSVELVCELDTTLLGGVVVEMDGRRIDGSLRHRLHEVKDVMNG